MPASGTHSPSSDAVYLIHGEEEYSVKQRAKEVFESWNQESSDIDSDVIDAAAANGGEALKAIARLHHSLQTLPFFGGAKTIWFQNCNFLGDDRTAGTKAVTEATAELATVLKGFKWQLVKLLISAGKIDKRKVFYKTLKKIGTTETYDGWKEDSRDWMEQAERFVKSRLKDLGKAIEPAAAAELVTSVGANIRQTCNEVDKLALFVGSKKQIAMEDVTAIVTRNRSARAFALADAVGNRNLSQALKRLDEDLWTLRTNRQRNEIGLLYGLISKVRGLIMLKELQAQGWIKLERDYNRFRGQLSRVPRDKMPADRKFNPLEINPYVLFRAAPQVKNYSMAELNRAMEILLDCNQKLIYSRLDGAMSLQQALVDMMSSSTAVEQSART